MSKQYFGMITFTPEQMKKILANSENVRSLNKANVTELENAIRHKTFKPNAAEIAFVEDRFAPNPLNIPLSLRNADCLIGLRLGDGFHRFNAAVNANLPFTTHVFVNTTPEEVAMIDQGSKRSAAAMGRVLGKESSLLPLAVKLEFGRGELKLKVSNAEKLDLREKHKEAVEFTEKNLKKGPIPAKHAFANRFNENRGNPEYIDNLKVFGKVASSNKLIEGEDNKVQQPALDYFRFVTTNKFADGKASEAAYDVAQAFIDKFVELRTKARAKKNKFDRAAATYAALLSKN